MKYTIIRLKFKIHSSRFRVLVFKMKTKVAERPNATQVSESEPKGV